MCEIYDIVSWGTEMMLMLFLMWIIREVTHFSFLAWHSDPQTSTRTWHNMTWQHSFCGDPSYVQSCIANHGSNVLCMLQKFERTEGCLLPQSKCEITKHVTTGAAEVRSNGGTSRQRGLNRLLDRLAMTNVNQNLTMCPIESDHSWTFLLLTP